MGEYVQRMWLYRDETVQKDGVEESGGEWRRVKESGGEWGGVWRRGQSGGMSRGEKRPELISDEEEKERTREEEVEVQVERGASPMSRRVYSQLLIQPQRKGERFFFDSAP
jgi:hypothetical protein